MGNKPIITRVAGYLYSAGTKKGFLKMERQGIPRPLFAIENQLAKVVKEYLTAELKQIVVSFKEKIKTSGVSGGKLTLDEDGTDPLREAEKKALLGTALANLETEWEWEEDDIPDLELEHKLADIIARNREDFQKKIYTDASEKMKFIIKSFSLDKEKIYETLLKDIEEKYLLNAIARVYGTGDLLKARFVTAINDYLTGKTKKLEIKEITEQLAVSVGRMSRFFARDQLARLNKATTLATFQAAKVSKVKWVTTHDVRVRKTHKLLDGQIFPINELPPELDDYNCRCGLVPVEWED